MASKNEYGILYKVASYAFKNAVFMGGYVRDNEPEEIWLAIFKNGEEPIIYEMTEVEALVILEILAISLLRNKLDKKNIEVQIEEGGENGEEAQA